MPFEFLEFAHETTEVLEPKGKSHVIAICDETNHLQQSQQRDILSRFIDLFAARKVQFLFVASHFPGVFELDSAAEAFDRIIDLQSLSNSDATELVRRLADAEGITADAESAALLSTRIGGNPRHLIQSMHTAMDIARSEKTDTMSREIIEGACELVARFQQP